MIDIARQINAIQREVGTTTYDGTDARRLVLRRCYDASVEDVWDACTNAERINRWFLPISGDLREGGTYQFEGNAGGKILKCEPPKLIRVTWEFGGGAPTQVEVRLAAKGADQTDFELEHVGSVPPEMWEQFGPGGLGVGWDGGLLGLGLHLASGETIEDKDAWPMSQEGRDFYRRSSQAWGTAYEKSGASPEAAAATVKQTYAFYTGDMEMPPN
jgi:uncharacterized protein YndB with AHSA1/START domain